MTIDVGMLLVRVLLGLAMASHGAQKLFGWFGGYGIKGTGGFMESLGFRPGTLFAMAAGGGEVLGGLLIALGLFGPVGPAIVLSVMVVAAVTVHLKNGFFAQNNGYEPAFLYSVAALGVAFAGPGAYSLDAVLGITALTQPTTIWIVLAAGVLAGLANLALRRAPAASEAGAAH